MNKESLARMHQQATAVVNGFAKVRDQQARDVLTLIAALAAQEHQHKSGHAQTDTDFASTFDEIFKDIFNTGTKT